MSLELRWIEEDSESFGRLGYLAAKSTYYNILKRFHELCRELGGRVENMSEVCLEGEEGGTLRLACTLPREVEFTLTVTYDREERVLKVSIGDTTVTIPVTSDFTEVRIERGGVGEVKLLEHRTTVGRSEMLVKVRAGKITLTADIRVGMGRVEAENVTLRFE